MIGLLFFVVKNFKPLHIPRHKRDMNIQRSIAITRRNLQLIKLLDERVNLDINILTDEIRHRMTKKEEEVLQALIAAKQLDHQAYADVLAASKENLGLSLDDLKSIVGEYNELELFKAISIMMLIGMTINQILKLILDFNVPRNKAIAYSFQLTDQEANQLAEGKEVNLSRVLISNEMMLIIKPSKLAEYFTVKLKVHGILIDVFEITETSDSVFHRCKNLKDGDFETNTDAVKLCKQSLLNEAIIKLAKTADIQSVIEADVEQEIGGVLSNKAQEVASQSK